jgi:AcrR family transcriptional regulator
MVEKRRGPGRPAYDSKQKLVAAMCALLAERGFEATSPTMVLQRSGIGHGSLYHHYRGKEDLALDAISHMRGHAIAFLEGQAQHTPPAADADIAAALDRLFARREGHALIRLLADPVAGAIKPLATATQEWYDDLRAMIVLALRGDQPGDDPEIAEAAARFLAPEFGAHADALLTAALGRGLLGLPRIALSESAGPR